MTQSVFVAVRFIPPVMASGELIQATKVCEKRSKQRDRFAHYR